MDLKSKPFYLSDDAIQWVGQTLASLTEDEKIGQLFCPIGISAEEASLLELTQKFKVGGVLFRAMPGVEIQNTHATLQKTSKIPLLLAANLETGGDGIAEDGTAFARQLQIAATGEIAYAKALGDIAAIEGAAVGVNWTLGPVADIDYEYLNPITNVRTYGSNPQTVSDFSAATMKRIQANNVACAVKHFPGDGADDRDQHLLTSVNRKSASDWDNSYGKIYSRLIDDGALSVMAGHIALPSYQPQATARGRVVPATLSSELLEGLLREKLGFNGLIVTDSTAMAGFCAAMSRKTAVPTAIASGCDMFLFNRDLGEDFGFMKDGLVGGILSRQRLDEAVTRILALKAAIGLHTKNPLVPGPEALSALACDKHLRLARDCADKAATLVKSNGDLPIDRQKHCRILLEVLGDTPSCARVESTVAALLEGEGFEVTRYVPENFSTFNPDAGHISEKYDLALYFANVETLSNRTVNRLCWHTFFGMGDNIPWFASELPTVFVSVGNPYHLMDVPMVRTYVNAYFNTDTVLQSVVEKLLGRSQFTGKNPVDPFCGRPDLALY